MLYVQSVDYLIFAYVLEWSKRYFKDSSWIQLKFQRTLSEALAPQRYLPSKVELCPRRGKRHLFPASSKQYMEGRQVFRS